MTAITVDRAASMLAIVALGLAAAGVAVSGYLAIENLQGDTGVCVGVQGCATVQKSKYGELLGVPVSVPGLLLYLVLAAAAAVMLTDFRGYRPEATLIGFFGAVAGIAMSAYLTYVEAFVLDAWCSYCIVSALLMTGLFAAWSTLLGLANRGQLAAA